MPFIVSPETFCWCLAPLPPPEELLKIIPRPGRFGSSFVSPIFAAQSNYSQRLAGLCLPKPDPPCHVPLTSSSALIPALKCIMKDVQNISKWHRY